MNSERISGGRLLAVLLGITLPAVGWGDDLNGGDTAWILTSTALVLFMTIPGLALFYGGLVRSKTCSRCCCSALRLPAWPPLSGWLLAIALPSTVMVRWWAGSARFCLPVSLRNRWKVRSPRVCLRCFRCLLR